MLKQFLKNKLCRELYGKYISTDGYIAQHLNPYLQFQCLLALVIEESLNFLFWRLISHNNPEVHRCHLSFANVHTKFHPTFPDRFSKVVSDSVLSCVVYSTVQKENTKWNWVQVRSLQNTTYYYTCTFVQETTTRITEYNYLICLSSSWTRCIVS